MLVEYLIVNFLIDHACRVVGPRIRLLTYDQPTQADLEKSLNPFYSYQPHGDLFDLQLHWGVTIEVKSTYNIGTGSLRKTQWWGPINHADNGPKLFPAQYYILAEIPLPDRSLYRDQKNKSQMPAMTCHICRGRDLDEAAKNGRSIGFKKWRDLAKTSCNFFDLPTQLRKISTQDALDLENKLRAGWRISRPSKGNVELERGERNFAPIARELDGGIETAWWDITDEPVKLDGIKSPWTDDQLVDWRDWEAAGFKYERAPLLDKNGKRLTQPRRQRSKQKPETIA